MSVDGGQGEAEVVGWADDDVLGVLQRKLLKPLLEDVLLVELVPGVGALLLPLFPQQSRWCASTWSSAVNGCPGGGP